MRIVGKASRLTRVHGSLGSLLISGQDLAQDGSGKALASTWCAQPVVH